LLRFITNCFIDPTLCTRHIQAVSSDSLVAYNPMKFEHRTLELRFPYQNGGSKTQNQAKNELFSNILNILAGSDPDPGPHPPPGKLLRQSFVDQIVLTTLALQHNLI